MSASLLGIPIGKPNIGPEACAQKAFAEYCGNFKTKALWGVLGTVGTFFVSILRALTFVTDYFYGYEVGAQAAGQTCIWG